MKYTNEQIEDMAIRADYVTNQLADKIDECFKLYHTLPYDVRKAIEDSDNYLADADSMFTRLLNFSRVQQHDTKRLLEKKLK